MPIGGEAEDYFWIDELVVSSKDGQAATGELTGRTIWRFRRRTA